MLNLRFVDAPCDFLLRDSSYPEHLASSVNNTGACQSNTGTTLRAR